MTWKDLLARRADLVGGMILVRIKDDGVYRARIDAIDASEPTVHFKTSKTLKENSTEKGSEWHTCRNMICRFPTTLTILGGLPGRVQLETPNGWVVIYTKDDPAVRDV